MLQRDRQLRTQIYQLKDAALFAIGLWLAHLLRFNIPQDVLGWTAERIDTFDHFVWLYLIIIPGAPLVLESQGFYQRSLFATRSETAWLLFKGCTLLTMGVILVLYFLQVPGMARGVIVLFGAISFLLVYITEEMLKAAYRSRFGENQFKKRILLVGTAEDTRRMREDFQAHKLFDAEVLAELDINHASIDELVRLLHETSANGVIVNAGHTLFGQVEKAIQACEREGVEAWLVADFFKTHISKATIDDFYGRPVLVFRSAPEASWQGVFKQALDITVSFVLLLFLIPFILIPVAIAIRLTSPGPVLFRQKRCGLNGRPFMMLKFRSMVTDAEQRKQELAALNEMGGPVFKITNDPRITPIGRWLRKFSIDELPQLINVLRGEMSLVGPRPLPVDEVRRFDDPAHRRRLSVKPGLTCLWQISGRNNVKDFKDWVRLDLEYIDNWSLWLDLKILWRTIPVVLMGSGAK
jgi:exopolysaccharide biosynthesis polyprenyl glycosylphosphotransferase